MLNRELEAQVEALFTYCQEHGLCTLDIFRDIDEKMSQLLSMELDYQESLVEQALIAEKEEEALLKRERNNTEGPQPPDGYWD